MKKLRVYRKYGPSEKVQTALSLHAPQIWKCEGYRYCSSKGEEKGVQ